jgi:hypothetical protein
VITLNDTRIEQFDKIVKTIGKGYRELNDYWLEWSLYTTFEYWLMVLLCIGSLVFVLIKIDKNKIFLVGFYGYSIHMTVGYLDMLGRNLGFWNFPFPLIPALPGLVLDSCIVPVTFMMVYQWTLNHNKNFYLYSFLTAIFFGFFFKPSMKAMGLLKLYGNANYFYVFLVYVATFLISRFLTNVFLWLQKNYSNNRDE